MYVAQHLPLEVDPPMTGGTKIGLSQPTIDSLLHTYKVVYHIIA